MVLGRSIPDVLFECWPRGEHTLVHSLNSGLIEEIARVLWPSYILSLQRFDVFGWCRHHKVQVNFLEFVTLLYDIFDLCVSDISVLEVEAITDKDHDVFGIRLGVSCLLSVINQISGHLGCVVPFKVSICLHESFVSCEERVNGCLKVLHPRI